jgi:hypothetical protein
MAHVTCMAEQQSLKCESQTRTLAFIAILTHPDILVQVL